MWDQGYTKCKCPILIVGTLNRKRIMLSTAKFLPPAEARDLDAAGRLARLWEKEGRPVNPSEVMTVTAAIPAGTQQVTIDSAIAAYIADRITQNISRSTLDKKYAIFTRGPNSLTRFAKEKGLRYVSEVDVTMLREYRASLRHADGELLRSTTRIDYQSSINGFIWFCQLAGWYPAMYADQVKKGLGRIRSTKRPTGYFPPEEYSAVLRAIETWAAKTKMHNGVGQRLYALTELMRWTGLRIRDALTLPKRQLVRDNASGIWSVARYQLKTNTWVYCPLPPDVAAMLLLLPPLPRLPNPEFYFWSGCGSPKSIVTQTQRHYKKIFGIADLREPDGTAKWCHPHMFRDTFAVETLLSGVRIETVSSMLGHRSIRTTQESYLPWVQARQADLNQSAIRSWAAQGKTVAALLPDTGGKPN